MGWGRGWREGWDFERLLQGQGSDAVVRGQRKCWEAHPLPHMLGPLLMPRWRLSSARPNCTGSPVGRHRSSLSCYRLRQHKGTHGHSSVSHQRARPMPWLVLNVLGEEACMEGDTESLCLRPHTGPSIFPIKRGRRCHPSRRDGMKNALLRH